MIASLKNYLHWLKSRGQRFPRLAFSPLPTPSLKVLFIVEQSIAPERTEEWQPILDKMISATRMPENKYRVIFDSERSATDLPESEIVVFLNEQPKPWFTWLGRDAITIYHPSVFQKQPMLKIAAWQDLQQVMKRVGVCN